MPREEGENCDAGGREKSFLLEGGWGVGSTTIKPLPSINEERLQK